MPDETPQQQVQQYEQQIALAREQNQTVAQQLAKAQQQVKSEQAMRTQTGIQGLHERQQAQAKINLGQEAIAQREQVISEAEAQVNAVKQQINAVNEDRQAYESARTDYLNNVPTAYVKGLERQYLQKMYEQDSSNVTLGRELAAGDTSSIQSALDTLKNSGLSETQALKQLGLTIKSQDGKSDINDVKISIPEVSKIEPISSQVITKESSVLSTPTTYERVQGFFKQKLGVSLPSSTNVKTEYNIVLKGAEPQSVEAIKPVKALDIVATPVYFVEQVSGLAGRSAEFIATEAGVPTYSIKQPSQIAPQRLTVGAPEFTMPKVGGADITVLSPQLIGSAVSIGTSLGAYGFMPFGLATASTLAAGSATVSDTTLPFNQRAFGAVEIGLGLVMAKGYLEQPLITLLKSPAPRHESMKTIRLVVESGKQIDIAQLKLIKETPPVKAEVYQKKWHQLFFSPEIVEVVPKRIDVIRTTPMLVKEGEIVGNAFFKSQREGANLFFYGKLEGKQVKITPEQFKSLTPTQQQGIQNILESKLGVPVSKDTAPILMGDGIEYSTGELTSTKFARVSPQAKVPIPSPRIKTFSQMSSVDKSYISDDVLGLSVKENIGGLKKGEIYLRDKKDLFVAKHEIGHYYDDKLGISKTIENNPKYIELAKKNLINRYGSEAEIPTSYLSNNKMVNELTADTFASSIRGNKIDKLYVKGSVEQLPYGKRVTRAESVGSAKAIIETPDYTIYRTKTAVKDVTMPNARVSGKPIVIEGESLVMKPIDITPPEANVNVISIQRLKVNPKTQAVVQKVEANLAKQFPRVNKPSLPKPINNAIGAFEEARPTIVGGTGTVSSFAGKGQYEITETQATRLNILPTNKVLIKDNTIQTSSTDTLTLNKQGSSNLLKDFTVTSQQPNTRELQRDMLKEEQISITDISQVQEQKQSQLSRQESAQDNLLKSRSREGTRPAIPISGFGLSSLKSSSKKSKKKLSVRQAFEVVTWKKGKEVAIAEGLPEGLAKKKGVEEVLGTLRASFKLKPKGTTVVEDVEYKIPEKLFRTGKKDVNRFVQRKGGKEGGLGRLASYGERSEIKSFNRKKKGGFKLF